jgi:5-methylcytosine-specific restriction endonuclease McrA
MDRPTTARRSSGRRKGAPAPAPLQLTSLPTHRGAYKDTREWLLERHGPVCAYCGQRTPEALITLDHVTPRRGRDAYDRRDNLVLACQRCNGLKADKPILAFLLARPSAPSGCCATAST